MIVAHPSLIGRIDRLVSSHRMNISAEAFAQRDLAKVLDSAGIQYEPEVTLSPGNRVDFMVAGSIAMEVKMRGQPTGAIHRQLLRYAEHDTVSSIILVGTVSIALEPKYAGKPAIFFSMGRAWL